MVKSTAKPRLRGGKAGPAVAHSRRLRSAAQRPPSPTPRLPKKTRAAGYRNTTKALLRSYPTLPTGPSGRRRDDARANAANQQPSTSAVGPEPSADVPGSASASVPARDPADDAEMDWEAAAEQSEDEADDDAAEIFSGDSRATSVSLWQAAEEQCHDAAAAALPLPATLWLTVFSWAHPMDLARLRQTCKHFARYLQNELTWRRSMELHLPRFPRPVFGLKEAEMLGLAFGRGCMHCDHSEREAAICWSFRRRLCTDCIVAISLKETELLDDASSIEVKLLAALPFGLVDSSWQWMADLPPVDVDGLERIYSKEDVEGIRSRHEEAREMLVENEWLEGLESDRKAIMLDMRKVERFTGAVHLMQLDWRKRLALQARPGRDTHTHLNGLGNGQACLTQNPNEPVPDAAELQAKRRKIIETRCLQLEPPLKRGVLMRIPAYQEATRVAAVLDDASWEALKTKILEQRLAAEGEEKRALSRYKSNSQDLQNMSDHSAYEQKLDKVISGVHSRLLQYAKDASLSWTQEINKDTAPEFAANILRYCRKEFFENTLHEVKSEPEDVEITLEDTICKAREKKLTVQDMRLVHDTVILPLIAPHRVNVFLCNGCSHNPRWWPFESLVQHFCSKHIYHPRRENNKVNWQMDWPDIGPFRSDPENYRHITAIAGEQESAQLGAKNSCNALPSGPLSFFLAGEQKKTAARAEYYGRNDEQQLDPLQEIAQDSRDAWFFLAGIRDMAVSVRMYFLVTRTALKYRSKFNHRLPLDLFLKVVEEHPLMKPIKGANGLHCLECQRGGPSKGPIDKARAEKLYSISVLLHHFSSNHSQRNQSGLFPDWSRDMVRLPGARTMAAVGESEGMTEEIFAALNNVLPPAFAKMLAGEEVNKPGEDAFRVQQSSRVNDWHLRSGSRQVQLPMAVSIGPRRRPSVEYNRHDGQGFNYQPRANEHHDRAPRESFFEHRYAGSVNGGVRDSHSQWEHVDTRRRTGLQPSPVRADRVSKERLDRPMYHPHAEPRRDYTYSPEHMRSRELYQSPRTIYREPVPKPNNPTRPALGRYMSNMPTAVRPAEDGYYHSDTRGLPGIRPHDPYARAPSAEERLSRYDAPPRRPSERLQPVRLRSRSPEPYYREKYVPLPTPATSAFRGFYDRGNVGHPATMYRRASYDAEYDLGPAPTPAMALYAPKRAVASDGFYRARSPVLLPRRDSSSEGGARAYDRPPPPRPLPPALLPPRPVHEYYGHQYRGRGGHDAVTPPVQRSYLPPVPMDQRFERGRGEYSGPARYGP